MIDINKKYRTRQGHEVILYKIWDNDQDYPVHGCVITGKDYSLQKWTLNGKYFCSLDEHSRDLFEYNLYDDLKIDDVIRVGKNKNPEKTYLRHFAGLTANNKIKTFQGGRSKFTNGINIIYDYWDFAIKVKIDD